MGAQADQVRDDILGRVLSRSLLPDDAIDEADLRDRLGLSGTPIREALISLEATGVIRRVPRGGARVMSLSLEQLMKMVEVLAEAEGAAAYRAARRINAAQAQRLRAAVQACLDNAEGRGKAGISYYDVNLQFHTVVLEATGNEYLQQAVFGTANRLIGYLSTRHDLPGEPLRSARDHAAIAQAILDADGDRARQLMTDHVTFSDTLALDTFNLLGTRTP